MKKIDSFTNLYSLQKTLRFKLIPVGQTAENFRKRKILDKDEHRANSYADVKKYLDRYYKAYLDKVLPTVQLDGLEDYAELYYNTGKTDSEKKIMQKMEAELRKQIAKALTNEKGYNSLLKADVIKTLPDFLSDAEEKEKVKEFEKFSTYFYGFWENRANMFTEEEQTTGIAHRCINDNLPRFLDNVNVFQRIRKIAPEIVEETDADFRDLFGIKAEDLFRVDAFTSVLSQPGIDRYNQVIGGYSNSDQTKTQGINEKINLYNQQTKDAKLPKLKQLYKQILSEKDTVSFIPEAFEKDDAVRKAIYDYYIDCNVCENAGRIKKLFCDLDRYDANGIFIENGAAVTEVSKAVFGSWDAVRCAWEKEYDASKGYKDSEKYIDTRSKSYKSVESFSIADINRLGGQITDTPDRKTVAAWAAERICDLTDTVMECYAKEEKFLRSPYQEEKKLCANYDRIGEIKELLDGVKALEGFVKLFLGSGKEQKDEVFYGELLSCYDAISQIDRLYDKVRNYVTQKPYSTDKIKLNFNCSSFLSGWATEYSSNGALIFEKDGLFYLGIVDKKFTNEEISFLQQKANDNPAYRIVYDFQKPDNKNTPRLFIRSKGSNYSPAVEQYGLPIEDVIELYDNGCFKTEYKKINPELYKESLVKLIDYFKLGFTRHESYSHYDYKWKESKEYNDISEFYRDVEQSCYALHKEEINFDNLLKLAAENKIYLFQIYNKDFSSYSHGNPNLHTLYFNALFDPTNLDNVVFKLNGGAEMFYRKASIRYDEEIMKNGHHYAELKDKFAYPIIKDKRYTEDQFMLHVPITLNFNAEGREKINDRVQDALKACDDNYVIGIDRGERNLLYISVINGHGDIVEQYSLNEIVNAYNGNTYRKDYHALLDAKEKERLDARKNWTAIENIKDLKEGYISQVIHKICELVEKYDAVIAMEDLNFGFKSSRGKVEKSVYQKFEKMLIDKLNFYVNKHIDPKQNGGLYHAYQLTEKFESFKKMGKQNGFIFYIPAWLTSKIDPTTGFVDLLYPRYESVAVSRKFFEKFKRISYEPDRDAFAFAFDYSDFSTGNTDYRKEWTLYTVGDRIENFRNHQRNGNWDCRTINLTDAFKELFAKYHIDLSGDMKASVLNCSERVFYRELTRLLKLTLQMRNSNSETGEDYLISPVMNEAGCFYDSRNYSGKDAPLPIDADANGAYHIAKKAMWAIEQIRKTEDGNKPKLTITKSEWLAYIQKR